MRTVGLKWNCVKLYGSFAALCFFLIKKMDVKKGVSRKGQAWDHRQNFDMPGVLCKARDDAGEWRKLYKGHLLHELICAGGSKWPDGRDRKSLRLTHGSQRLLMPEEVGQLPKNG